MAALANGAKYAGEADPYKKPPVDDDEDEEDEEPAP